ncbi:hypothetical protein FZEAL_76 [Fusarium zealandicum]|uniref:Uncharacterized protein n=1 Tax=Fusarium zealandicum TaxID=1053134 RepID=A0A8H4UVU9_9HYPO|nr:hypothetical protein FZEAL_76 [Fusarium zealandicum]
MPSARLICTKVTPECPLEYTIYGYEPNPYANGFFAVFFLVCCIAHMWLGIRFSTKGYTIALTLGCAALVLGYLGRLGLYFQPFNHIPFQAQVCCLIIAPAFNSAAIYIMLKHMVELFGAKWSILEPKQYTVIFITADLISLVLQATGGGLAATAALDDEDQINLGNNVMMAGIAFQVVTLSIFAILAILYLVRRVRARALDPFSVVALETWLSVKFRWFLFGVVTAFMTIFIRCVYRIAEMRGGWGNPLMKDQITFVILEGCMLLIATSAQTVLHPGHFFPAMAHPRMHARIWTEVTEMPILSK